MPLSPLDQFELEAVRRLISPPDFAALIRGFRNEIERSQIELRTAETPTTIERVCHRLIGVSAPIGLRDLAAKARDAQKLARERSSNSAQSVPLAELEDAMSVAIEALYDVLA